MTFGTKKLKRCGNPNVFGDIHFDRIHKRDKQTDRQTPHDGAYA